MESSRRKIRHVACTLCGSPHNLLNFKGGYVCGNCVHFIKELYHS